MAQKHDFGQFRAGQKAGRLLAVPKAEVRRLLAELPQSGMHRVPRRFFRDVRRSCEDEGWRVFVLPDGIKDEASFVRAAKAVFPLTPLWKEGGWFADDAWNDSLWDGLLDLPERRFAILWPDATTLAYSDPKTYGRVLYRLENVVRDLADAEYTVGNPKDLAVVVGT